MSPEIPCNELFRINRDDAPTSAPGSPIAFAGRVPAGKKLQLAAETLNIYNFHLKYANDT